MFPFNDDVVGRRYRENLLLWRGKSLTPMPYVMNLRRHEELLREAEYERLIRAAHPRQQGNWKFPRQCANWLGTQLVRLGRRLERFGTFRETQLTPSPSPHH